MGDTTPPDVFLSHASPDKSTYVEPLAKALSDHSVSFWLDSQEIKWGDDIVRRMNDGLRGTKYAVLCLSANFVNRPWPENELSAILSLQNAAGQKRVLP